MCQENSPHTYQQIIERMHKFNHQMKENVCAHQSNEENLKVLFSSVMISSHEFPLFTNV